jgi:hypothetical protein
MSEIITFMFVPAKLQMNCASASGINIRRSEPGDRATPTPSVTEMLPEFRPRGMLPIPCQSFLRAFASIHRVYRITVGADDDSAWYADWLLNLSDFPDIVGGTRCSRRLEDRVFNCRRFQSLLK